MISSIGYSLVSFMSQCCFISAPDLLPSSCSPSKIRKKGNVYFQSTKNHASCLFVSSREKKTRKNYVLTLRLLSFFFLLISVHIFYVSVPRFGEAGGDVELTIPALLRATPKLIRQLLLLQNIYKYIPKFGL